MEWCTEAGGDQVREERLKVTQEEIVLRNYVFLF